MLLMEYQVGPTGSVSAAVLEAVRACGEHESPDDKTLYDVVDPDALDDLFAPTSDDSPRPGGRVSFIYENYLVVIQHGEYIEVHPLDKPCWREANSPHCLRALGVESTRRQ